jgi:hypothetical protein
MEEGDNLRHPFVARIGNNMQQLGDSFTPDRRDNAELGKVSPDRVNHHGLLADEEMTCAVKHHLFGAFRNCPLSSEHGQTAFVSFIPKPAKKRGGLSTKRARTISELMPELDAIKSGR